jgi:hypothetical protein
VVAALSLDVVAALSLDVVAALPVGGGVRVVRRSAARRPASIQVAWVVTSSVVRSSWRPMSRRYAIRAWTSAGSQSRSGMAVSLCH